MDSYRINKLKHVSCTRNDEQLGLGDPVFDDVCVLDRDQSIVPGNNTEPPIILCNCFLKESFLLSGINHSIWLLFVYLY